MIPRASKRSCKKVPERNDSEKEWWGSSKNPEDGKAQKWFIFIAIWMKSIEHSTKREREKGNRIEHFHSSRFLFKFQSCNIAVVVSTKLNQECNVLCFSKQKALCAFGCWWHMVNVLLYGVALFLSRSGLCSRGGNGVKRKLWMSVIHISFGGDEKGKNIFYIPLTLDSSNIFATN